MKNILLFLALLIITINADAQYDPATGELTIGLYGNSGNVKIRRGTDGNVAGIIGYNGGGTEAHNLAIQSTSGGGYITFVTNYGVGEKVRIANNGNVGIGINTPLFKLHVTDRIKLDGENAGMWIENGMSDWFFGRYANNLRFFHNGDRLVLTPDGKVGIGTGNPSYLLDVKGTGRFFDGLNLDIALSMPGGENGIVFNVSEYTGYSRFNIWNHKNTTQSARYLELRYNSDNSGLAIRKGGNVGIGTTTPDYKLSVNDTIGAKEVKVTSSGWPDFVFESDYILPTLQEVENFIDQNGHLPDIPSAEDVKADGISLGEMDAKLLQKIEELTLYVIEQQKELIELKKADDQKAQVIEELKEENQQLKVGLLNEIETIKAQLK